MVGGKAGWRAAGVEPLASLIPQPARGSLHANCTLSPTCPTNANDPEHHQPPLQEAADAYIPSAMLNLFSPLLTRFCGVATFRFPN